MRQEAVLAPRYWPLAGWQRIQTARRRTQIVMGALSERRRTWPIQEIEMGASNKRRDEFRRNGDNIFRTEVFADSSSMVSMK